MKPRTFWTEEQISLLREFYPHFHTSKVAQAVGRSVGQCYQKAKQLGLSKTERYLASDDACRVSASRRTPAMQATQFKPGQSSWNKGLHYQAGGRSAETQFKPGRAAHEASNYVPIGSLKVSGDGYLYRKVTDDQKLVPARRWAAEHRLVWEAEHGPIPQGYVVVFKSGRRTTVLELITLDVLELLTRTELMKRNTLHNRYPKEVTQLMQLKGAINRQINRITKEKP
ncbi:HNH endonuclease signature motif containing protein [Variovorax sp. ZT5P49]|uniref:HNH endonuclease signature motif containing protein n=1 Tax=Variovorax sp. ZT5P49 TaxID=3443733 RepID=UPI003F48624A